MLKCKLNRCSEEAVPGAVKRYCAVHLEAYLQKKKEAKKREKTAPRCDCGELARLGSDECRACQSARLEQEDYQREYDALPKCSCGKVALREGGSCRECNDKALKKEKLESFAAAQTVGELKDWIRKYML